MFYRVKASIFSVLLLALSFNSALANSSIDSPRRPYKYEDSDYFAVANKSIPTREVSGEEFRKLFSGQLFIKILNKAENHHGFQYQTGLCALAQDFSPSGSGQAGGLYFTTLASSPGYFSYGDHGRIIKIPDDARIWVDGGNKFKADKLLVCERLSKDLINKLNSKGKTVAYKKVLTAQSAMYQTESQALQAAKQNTEPDLGPFFKRLNSKLFS